MSRKKVCSCNCLTRKILVKMDINSSIRPATLEEAFDLRPVQRSTTKQETNNDSNYPIGITVIERAPVDLKYEKKPFIEANTQEVNLMHLSNDCIIPVFSKDNEKTIAHQEYIEVVMDAVKKAFPRQSLSAPEIRVSHQIKGRSPGAIHKSAKDLLEEDKTV